MPKNDVRKIIQQYQSQNDSNSTPPPSGPPPRSIIEHSVEEGIKRVGVLRKDTGKK